MFVLSEGDQTNSLVLIDWPVLCRVVSVGANQIKSRRSFLSRAQARVHGTDRHALISLPQIWDATSGHSLKHMGLDLI